MSIAPATKRRFGRNVDFRMLVAFRQSMFAMAFHFLSFAIITLDTIIYILKRVTMAAKVKQLDKNSAVNPMTTGRTLGDTAKLFIIGVVTFLAALIWRDALRQIFIRYFPRNDLLVHTIIAVIVSVFAVFAIYYLSKGLTPNDLQAGAQLEQNVEE
jgi:uncharacterized membrane protein YidH (DUF202 family)